MSKEIDHQEPFLSEIGDQLMPLNPDVR